MAVKLMSNRGSYYRNGVDGIGGRNLPDGLISWIGLTGKAGDVAYLSAADCTTSNKVDQGYYFQSVGSSVTVDRTLQNIGMACDPDPAVQAGVHWVSPTVVAPGAIVQTAVAFAAIRITFAADGEFYIVAR